MTPTGQLTLTLYTDAGQRYFFCQPVSLTAPVGLYPLPGLYEGLRSQAKQLCEQLGAEATQVELGFEDGRLL